MAREPRHGHDLQAMLWESPLLQYLAAAGLHIDVSAMRQ
jgi:hypothetical protein